METHHSRYSKHNPSGSYRTYEEWKPHDKDVLPNGQLVLTVPMRNGNLIVTSVKSLDEFYVLTVPMRNGNA